MARLLDALRPTSPRFDEQEDEFMSFANTLARGPRLSGMDALEGGANPRDIVGSQLATRRMTDSIVGRELAGRNARTDSLVSQEIARRTAGTALGAAPASGTEIGGRLVSALRSRADEFAGGGGGGAAPYIGTETVIDDPRSFDRFPPPPTELDRQRAFDRLGESPLSGSGPGTAAFNNETRGIRRVASLLRRGARAAIREGDYERAADLTGRALGMGMGTGMTDRDVTNRNFATQVQAGRDTAAKLANPIIPGQEQPAAAEGGAMGASPRTSRLLSSDRNRWTRDQWTTR